MIAILAILVLPAASPAQQASVQAYQQCLAPIVRANATASDGASQALEVILERISAQCSSERAAAREALASYAFSELQRVPTDADKEELIQEATVRWANSISTNAVIETLERN